MLHFFRKYQKFFFIVVTAAVVMSFAFYGTYQAFAPALGKGDNQNSYQQQMAAFLNTEQWMMSKRLFGVNFLNDGVISIDFLETGIADLVANTFPERFKQDFESRLEKEKNYTPYTHPYVPSLSAMSLWSMFAPDMPTKLQAFLESDGSFKVRKELFLAQKQFPPGLLAQLIRYQEKNNPQIPADSRLSAESIALFGYTDFSEWFGESFVETLASLVIQTAEYARKQGYKASKEEVMADLIMRSQTAYKSFKDVIQLPVNDGYGLLQLYLRQIGMSEQTAIKIWEDVTLFRRLLQAAGSTALTDPLALSRFYAFAYENATIELTQMPAELKFQSMEELKRFETYLAAVGDEKKSPLDIPLNYASIETVASRAPELVGTRYRLFVAKTSKKAQQAKVSFKETLAWECDPQNWNMLSKHFPELAGQSGEPFEIVEKMDERGKRLVHAFARKQIVDAHPEWIHESLLQAEMEEKELFLSAKAKKIFEGIRDMDQFSAALEEQKELIDYTQDGETFYRILVDKRGEEKEILTFKEALQDGLLDKLSEPLKVSELLEVVVNACPPEYREHAYAYRFAEYLLRHDDGSLTRQFPVEHQQKTVTRSESFFIPIDSILSMEVGCTSSLKIHPNQGAYLYHCLDKSTESSFPEEKLRESQHLISQEACRRFFEKLLPQLSSDV